MIEKMIQSILAPKVEPAMMKLRDKWDSDGTKEVAIIIVKNDEGSLSIKEVISNVNGKAEKKVINTKLSEYLLSLVSNKDENVNAG